jgi:hypothetical protein
MLESNQNIRPKGKEILFMTNLVTTNTTALH